MWTRRDWHEFFHRMSLRWEKYRPPRPVVPSQGDRVVPAAGFSVRELSDVGLTVEQAEMLGLPVDAGRIGSHTANVSALRVFVQQARTRG
jgi:ribosomal protein L13E